MTHEQCQPAPDGVCERLDCPNHGPPTKYSLHITDPREFAKEIARHMRQADAPLDTHQVITLFHFIEARSSTE